MDPGSVSARDRKVVAVQDMVLELATCPTLPFRPRGVRRGDSAAGSGHAAERLKRGVALSLQDQRGQELRAGMEVRTWFDGTRKREAGKGHLGKRCARKEG